jgi:uncharacterized protein (DUF1697 family)
VANVQVAFLRGINVGPSKRVRMTDLRALVEELGYTHVRTTLTSGNIVFSSPRTAPSATAARIEKALQATLGVSARVIVVSAEELAEVVKANPLVEIAESSSRLLLGVLADPADREKLVEIARKDWGQERIALIAAGAATHAAVPGASRAVYMWMPRGVIASKLNAAVSKALGEGVTARTWATMLKLLKMAEETPRR